ncbi:hypothetical protein QQP08_020413 [Theobroma cacao]|nr:hypothetical protein QQP08_020413 [Theobroma cacao]
MTPRGEPEMGSNDLVKRERPLGEVVGTVLSCRDAEELGSRSLYNNHFDVPFHTFHHLGVLQIQESRRTSSSYHDSTTQQRLHHPFSQARTLKTA